MDNQIPPVTPVPPAPPIPPVLPPAEKSRNWLKILLAIIGVLVVLGLFANLYLLAKNQKSVTKITPTPTPIAVTPTIDSIANWKTLLDKNLGISFKYPQDWTKDEENPTGIYIYARETFEGGPQPLRYYIFGEERKNPNKLTFEELVTKDIGEDLKQQFKYSQEIIGGYTVYKTDKLPSASGALNVFFTRDGTNYIVIGLAPYNFQTPFETQNKYLEIFDQILSTFRFD